ncbi:MAG: class I SAM-dependent methyltransferase [Planctomycetota bacterium]
MTTTNDRFHEPYDREDIAYGDEPSAPLAAYLEQVAQPGKAYDVGAGAGRDTLALAKAGFDVTAIDLSDRGLERIRERASLAGVGDHVTTREADVRDVEFPVGGLQGVVATTVLDHIPAPDADLVWGRMCDSLNDYGFLYVEVHTTEDPASGVSPGRSSDAPISETADAVVNYFQPNQLATLACDAKYRLRILRYEERLEWDCTHGPEHLHGKAILLATRAGHHPDWYGQPAAFPRSH